MFETDADRERFHQEWLTRERLTERPILVHITDTRSGETRIDKNTGLWNEDGEFQDFIWSEGNYACDCNRGLFFANAVGDEEDDDHACGADRYKVRICDELGTELYRDDV
jgi:hypothetical protein